MALIWAMAIGPFTPANFAIGFVLAYITLRLCIPRDMRGSYYHKVGRTVRFCFYVLVELVIANIKMAYYTLSPLRKLKPGVLAVPLVEDLTDTELTILANLITLTPGTLSLDVSADKSILFIHFMHVEDPEASRREIKDGFERRLLEVTR
ncbi:MAG: Na+/H+ antiporter subunit E [Phycisphaerales bacterium JB064]